MKKLVVCAVVFLSAALFTNASAQYRPSDNNNTESQPGWGQGNGDYVEYFYLPEIDTYYYVPRKQFIYQSGGYWTFSSSLPKANKGYDLYSGSKVVINQPGAYRYYSQHKEKYGTEQANNAKNAVGKSTSKSKKQTRNSDKGRS